MKLKRFVEDTKYRNKKTGKIFEVQLDEDCVNLLLEDRIICCANEDVAYEWLLTHDYDKYEEVK